MYNQILKDCGMPYDIEESVNAVAVTSPKSKSEPNSVTKIDPFKVCRNEILDQIEVDTSFQPNSTVDWDINNLEGDSYHTVLHQKSTKDKLEAERLAAMRSLKTNLILILFFFTTNLFLLIPSKNWQLFFGVSNTSFQKTLVPIATTMANFGTIRSVCSQYWSNVSF